MKKICIICNKSYIPTLGQLKNRQRRCRDCIAKQNKNRRLIDFKRVNARDLLRKQIKNGRIKRQPCQICGYSPSEAHHDDYSKPFEVKWLCRKHHAELHRKDGGTK